MFLRRGAGKVHDLLTRFPAVVLTGPRQCGKTTLAHQLAAGGPSVYLDLELPADNTKLYDVEAYVAGNAGKLIILDEVQRTPELFAPLRAIIDKRKRQGMRAGQFLLLGSASFELLRQTSESLAGRMTELELAPFDALETTDPVEDLWVRGGFPQSYLAPDSRASVEWRDAFIRTYLERDIPWFAPRIAFETLRRLWRMLAHEQGQMLNAARLAGSLGVSGQTVARYLDLLVDMLLARRLPPWEVNEGKRLVRSPKVYLRDSGIVHSLLGLRDREDVLGHPVAGPSWEGFVIENILNVFRYSREATFYRTSAGAEIDLVLNTGRERWAIEIKRNTAPRPGRGFHIGCEDIGAKRRYLVYPGEERYNGPNGIVVTPLRDLLREVAAV